MTTRRCMKRRNTLTATRLRSGAMTRGWALSPQGTTDSAALNSPVKPWHNLAASLPLLRSDGVNEPRSHDGKPDGYGQATAQPISRDCELAGDNGQSSNQG